MKFRPRYPVASEYACLLGYMLFTYALLEWQVVYVGEKLSPGFLSAHAAKVGGTIAREFKKAVVTNSTSLAPDVFARLEKLATTFSGLNKRRNALMHARPITMPGTDRTPGLQYSGVSGEALWTTKELQETIASIEVLANDANDIYYNAL